MRSSRKQKVRRVTSALLLRPSEALLLRERYERGHSNSSDASFDSTTVETGAREEEGAVPLRPVQVYDATLSRTIYWG